MTLSHQLRAGYITTDHYTGEMGKLLAGKVHGRQSNNDVTIFKTVGTAILDIVAASKIVAKAEEQGLGTKI